MKKTKSGISLIVLVITILVLSILAATVIITISNTNVIDQAGKTVFKSDMVNYREAYEMYVAGMLAEDSSFDRTTLVTSDLETILGEVEGKYKDGLKVQDGKLVYETEDETENEIIKSLGMQVVSEYISKGESYAGYYADVDGDGKADGIIFADLYEGKKGTYHPYGSSSSYGMTYSYSAVAPSSLKDYYISQESYSPEGLSGYETMPVLTAVGDGADRFYVMALDDFYLDVTNYNGTTTRKTNFHWYAGAYENGISDYSEVTKAEFGKGKTNTQNMIEKWNKGDVENGGYGKQNADSAYLDVWGAIQEKVYGDNEKTLANVKWFVPSRDEWCAFLDWAGIDSDNRYKCNFGYQIHTSTLASSTSQWGVGSASGPVWYGQNFYIKSISNTVRLATTF